VIFDQRVDDRPGLQVRWMAVIRGQRFTAFEVAQQDKIHRTARLTEVPADFHAQQAGNTIALRLERGANRVKSVTLLRLQSPNNDMHDMPDHDGPWNSSCG
jgi:hypothetical protein